MMPTPEPLPSFADLLTLIDDRSAAFRCPDWSLRDLVVHLGEGHRVWATVVAAGPADTRRAPGAMWQRAPPRPSPRSR
jgi:hypothetical protein